MNNNHSDDFVQNFQIISKAFYQSKGLSRGYTVGKDNKQKFKKENEEYREARVEVLRRLYEENPVEEEKVLLYEHPTDGRKNIYIFDAVEEKPYSPFDDLVKLEELMPNPEDYYGKD